MKQVRVIVVGIAVCFIAAAAVVTAKYVHRHYQVKSLPLIRQEETVSPRRELAQKSYINLPVVDVQRLLTGGCATIRKPDELPEAIKNGFATLTDDKPFALAAPGSRFNATDVIEPGLPRRRLVLGGHCEDRWFIEYEHGGIGKSTALMVLRINPANTKFSQIANIHVGFSVLVTT